MLQICELMRLWTCHQINAIATCSNSTMQLTCIAVSGSPPGQLRQPILLNLHILLLKRWDVRRERVDMGSPDNIQGPRQAPPGKVTLSDLVDREKNILSGRKG